MEHKIPLNLIEEISTMVKELASVCLSMQKENCRLYYRLTPPVEEKVLSTYRAGMDHYYGLQPRC